MRNVNLSIFQGNLLNFVLLNLFFFHLKLSKPFMSELSQAFLNRASNVSLFVALL